MANSALEIYMRLHHHYSAAPGSSEREQNDAQKGFKDGYSEGMPQRQMLPPSKYFTIMTTKHIRGPTKHYFIDFALCLQNKIKRKV